MKARNSHAIDPELEEEIRKERLKNYRRWYEATHREQARRRAKKSDAKKREIKRSKGNAKL